MTRVRGSRAPGLLPFLLVLLGAALFTHVAFFIYLLYALVAIYLLSRLWARRSLAAVSVARRHDARAFLDQQVSVEVEVRNRGVLPVLWLHLSDALPTELSAGWRFHQVLSLMPREATRLIYSLSARRRGYHRFGAVTAQTGDLLGSATYETRQAAEDAVIVYPKIVPLQAGLPSQSPLGTLPSQERLFEDPSRIQGMRDYQPGDSLRRVDWKTSGRLGRLQVRRYEPAIALETALYLNLNGEDYPGVARYQATELGIVVAASLAVHIAEKRQAVGLVTNGRDPFEGRGSEVAGGTGQQAEGPSAQALPPRKGREHAMHLLDLLARLEVTPGDEAIAFLDLLVGASGQTPRLPWGSTLVAITGREVEGLMEALLTLRRRGLEVVLVLTSPDRDMALTTARAQQIGARAVAICSERDLEAWR